MHTYTESQTIKFFLYGRIPGVLEMKIIADFQGRGSLI